MVHIFQWFNYSTVNVFKSVAVFPLHILFFRQQKQSLIDTKKTLKVEYLRINK